MKIIAGMHRSGTSIVTRLLMEAGADLGNPDTFYKPDKWNPDGYFEQPEFHAINMPLVNGPYWKFSYFRLPSDATIRRRAARFDEEIRQTSTRYQGKVVKAVRMCLTMPAWIEHGAHFDRILVCLREPVDVAKSVRRRNKVTLSRVYKLWYEHNTRLIANAAAADVPLWIIYYRDLLDPETFRRELGGALGFFGLPHDEATLERLQGLMKTPRHLASEGERPPYPAKVEQLWRELLARHEAQFADASTMVSAGR